MFFTKTNDVTDVTTTKKFNSIQDYLASRGISIESTCIDDERYSNEALANFAEKFAELQCKGGDPFIKYLRTQIVGKNCHCNFAMRDMGAIEKDSCIELANLLCTIGALVNAVECDDILRGKLNLESPKLINFINGGFLEIAIFAVAKRVIAEYSRPSSLDFELLPNVITTGKSGKKEYDLLARIGSEFYVVEVKSGRNEDFCHYKESGLELGMWPDHQIVITSDRSDEEMTLISYLESIRVTNYSNFKEQFLNIIKRGGSK